MRSKLTIYIFGLIIFAFCLPMKADASSGLAAIYNKGNEFYEKGDYEKAAEAYREAINAGANNAFVHYNLGNSYMRFSKPRLGLAIASYRRSLKFAPRDSDVRYNLEVARAKIVVKLPKFNQSSLTGTWKWVISRVKLTEIGLAFSLSFLLFCVSIMMRNSSSNGLLKKLGLVVIVVSIITLIVSAVGFYSAWGASNRVEGVIIADELSARSGPGEDNTEAFKVSDGVEVFVGERRSDWFNISVPGGLTGWVPSEAVEII